jgi:L-aminopeptidase/D-esterase-like protein
VFAGWFSQNGNGEMTGTTWIEEAGFLEGPIFITNTHSVGVVRDASIKWAVEHGANAQAWSLPVVAETWDGSLNDINGFHVKPEHVFAALDGARTGRVAEGNVGGGTGMRCYGFKCGTGTASRKVDARFGGYTVGVLVQANHGTRDLLRVAGVPVGQELPQSPSARANDPAFSRDALGEVGSIIIVVGTDATAPAASAQAPGAAGDARARGGPAACRATDPATSSWRSPPPMPAPPTARTLRGVDAVESRDRRRLRADGAGDGRSDHQRARRRGDDDRRRRPSRRRNPARGAARGAAQVQPAGAIGHSWW